MLDLVIPNTLEMLKLSIGINKSIKNDRRVIDTFNANNYFGVPRNSAKIYMTRTGDNILNITIFGNPDHDTNENKNSTSLKFNSSTNSNDYDETSSNELTNIVNDFSSAVTDSSNSNQNSLETKLKQVASGHNIVDVANVTSNIGSSKKDTYSVSSHSIDKPKNSNSANYGVFKSSVYRRSFGGNYRVTTTNYLNGRERNSWTVFIDGSLVEWHLRQKKESFFRYVAELNRVSKPILKPKDMRIPTNCCIKYLCNPTKYKKA